MGQGQADVAVATLRECSRNGEWLCLKNLHLVTAWLPLLEKVGACVSLWFCSIKGSTLYLAGSTFMENYILQ